MSERIIQKGEYKHETSSAMPIVPKQYIMTEENGTRHLLFSFENRSPEQLTSLRLNLIQYGAGEKILKESIVEFKVTADGNAFFAPKKKLPLLSACVDFKLDILKACYGSVAYTSEGGTVKPVFLKKEKKAFLKDRTEFYAEMHEKKHTTKPRTMNSFVFFIPLVTVIVVLLSFIIGREALLYSTDKDSFTLNDISYKFIDPTLENSPIEIVAYTGKSTRITVPNEIDGFKIVSIGENAFKNSAIREIVIECSELVIKKSAFENCRQLTSFTANSVSEIGENTFAGCERLTAVSLGDKLIKIGNYAFYNCGSVVYITLPESLEIIGDGVFLNCTSLEELKIPAGVVSVGVDFLANCTAIRTLELPFIGQTGDSVSSLAAFIGAPSERRNLTSLTVGYDGKILANMFSDEIYLKSVKFTGKITEIGEAAFQNCTALKEFTVPDDVTAIGKGAFKNCSALAIINLNAKLTVLPAEMLQDCKILEDILIPSSVTTLETRVFAGCSALKSLKIPTNVTSIAKEIIAGCSSLETLKIGNLPQNGTVTYLANGSTSFRRLREIEISYAFTLPNSCFANLKGLETVKLPADLTGIGDSAFSGCTSLREIEIPASVASIGKAAFKNCESLDSIVLSSISAIKDETFFNCYSLTEITLPDSVKTVGALAFKGCYSLKKATLPAGISSIGKAIFAGCNGITELTIPFVGHSSGESGGSLDSFFNDSDVLLGYSAVPATLKKVSVLGGEISEKAFTACYGITEVALLGSSTTTIKAGAFANCTALRKITLPNGLATIEEGAFTECKKLYTAINKTGKPISEFGCPELTESVIASFADEANVSTVTVSGFTMLLGDDGYWYATEYVGSGNGYTYTEIYDFPSSFTYGEAEIKSYRIAHSFVPSTGDYNVKTVNIPASVESIGSYAFARCYSLKTVSIPQDSTLKTIGEYAFQSCYTMRFFPVTPSVAEIKTGAFQYCSGLVGIFNTSALSFTRGDYENNGGIAECVYKIFNHAPTEVTEEIISGFNVVKTADIAFLISRDYSVPAIENLTVSASALNLGSVTGIYIGANLFNYNTDLKTLTIGSDVDFIGNQAFYQCSKLESLTIENGVEYIGTSAFAYCSMIQKVTVPASVTSLGESAFYSCSGIKEAVILANVSEIPTYLFAYCGSINTVTIPENVTSIASYAFSGNNIYEVVNLSALEISIGSYEFGEIASRAIKLRGDGDEKFVFTYQESNGSVCVFAKDSEGTYLCNVINKNNESIIVLPNFYAGGSATNYKLHHSFANGFGSATGVLVPSCITNLSALSNLYWQTIYYTGTQEQFEELTADAYIYSSVYYYAQCIHSYGNRWRYDENSMPTTALSLGTRTDVNEPTCTSEGECTYVCPHCGHREHVILPRTEHTYQNGVCLDCGAHA